MEPCDCESCLDDRQDERIEELERRVKELEARPPIQYWPLAPVPTTVPQWTPYPLPVSPYPYWTVTCGV